MEAAISAIETMKKIDANILIQEFISESRGEDIRAIVVGTVGSFDETQSKAWRVSFKCSS